MLIRRFFTNDHPEEEMMGVRGHEYHHMRQVARRRVGDPVHLFNGKGWIFEGQVHSLEDTCARVTVHRRLFVERPPTRTIIAVSLLKPKSMSLLVEKLSECGIDEIMPVIFARTDTNHYPRHLEKWKKIALLSLGVNGESWPTRIHPPRPLPSLLSVSHSLENRIMLDLEADSPAHVAPPLPVMALIGPPGDFTPEERDALIQSQFTPCKINRSVLKSDTAAISMAGIMKNSLDTHD